MAEAEAKRRAGKLQNKNRVKVIFHGRNMGKGAAIRTAIPHLSGDITIIQDADLEYNPKEFINLIKPITNGKSNVVYGSRFLKKNPLIYRRYYLGNKLLSFFTSILYFQKITDEYTCYKMIKTEILKSLNFKSKGFEFEAEITVKLLKAGYRIYEIPISYSPRKVEEGKKISWKDAFLGIWTIIKEKIFCCE